MCYGLDESKIQEYLGLTNEKFIEYTNLLLEENENFANNRFDLFHSKDEPLLGLSMYSYYPLFFKELFNTEEFLMRKLIIFSHYHFLSLFLLDQIYDSNKIRDSFEIIVLVRLYQKAAYYMKDLVKDHEDLMAIIEENQIYNDTSMINEKYSFNYKQTYSPSIINDYCKDKYVYAKSALDIYNFFGSTNDYFLKDLKLSHDYFAVGRQYLDDSIDYQEDSLEGGFNIYTYYFYQKHSANIDLYEDKEILSYLIEEAKMNLKKSISSIEHLPDTGWKRYLEAYSKRLNNYKVEQIR